MSGNPTFIQCIIKIIETMVVVALLISQIVASVLIFRNATKKQHYLIAVLFFVFAIVIGYSLIKSFLPS